MLASSMLERLGKDLLSERAMMCPSCPVAFRLSRAAVRRDTPGRRCFGSCNAYVCLGLYAAISQQSFH